MEESEKKKGGRPRKSVDIMELKEIYGRLNSYRRTAEEYNMSRRGKHRISHEQVRRILNLWWLDDKRENGGEIHQEATGGKGL